MSSVETGRLLAPSEETFAASEVYVAYTVRVAGDLDLIALSRAFDALCDRYPVLTACLEPAGDGFVLGASSARRPAVTRCGNEAELLCAAARLHQRDSLSALFVVSEEDTDVTLAVHHSVADAQHALAIFADLWQLFGDGQHEPASAAAPRPYPASVEELFAARGLTSTPTPSAPTSGQRGAGTAQAPGDPARGVEPEREFRSAKTVRFRLTADETSELVELGHRRHVTIHGLVSGAIILTEAQIRKLPLTEIVYFFSVDLRNLLLPRVGPTEGTNVVGFSIYVPTASDADLVGIGDEVCERLRSGLAHGSVQQSALQTVDGTDEGLQHHLNSMPGLVVSTNWGRIPEFRVPEGLSFADFRSTMFEKPLAAREVGRADTACTYVISIFGGRLSIEVHHLEEHAEQQQRRIAVLESVVGKCLGEFRESKRAIGAVDAS